MNHIKREFADIRRYTGFEELPPSEVPTIGLLYEFCARRGMNTHQGATAEEDIAYFIDRILTTPAEERIEEPKTLEIFVRCKYHYACDDYTCPHFLMHRKSEACNRDKCADCVLVEA